MNKELKEIIFNLPQWSYHEDIKEYDKYIIDLFQDKEHPSNTNKLFRSFSNFYNHQSLFPNREIFERYRLTRFPNAAKYTWAYIFKRLLAEHGFIKEYYIPEEIKNLQEWPYYKDIKEYDQYIIDLFYDPSVKKDSRSRLFKTFCQKNKRYKFPNEDIINRFYKERYPDKTIDSWINIINELLIEHGIIEKPKHKHIDVLKIKPWPYYEDIKEYDDLILDTFYDPNANIVKVTNAYQVMNEYNKYKIQCKDKDRWPETFPNIDIIERYVKERYSDVKSLDECIYRLTVEKGLEKGYYCQHCGKLLWCVNWGYTSRKQFCSDECKLNDKNYYDRWMNGMVKSAQNKDNRIKRSKSNTGKHCKKCSNKNSKKHKHSKFYGTYEYTSINNKVKTYKKYKQEYECYLRFKEVFPDALHASCFENNKLNIPGYQSKDGLMYNADIYIPSINMIIECQYFPSHGDYPYNPKDDNLKNIEDMIMSSYKMRHVPEENRLRVYEVTDPAKRKVAKDAGFNYGEIWHPGSSWEFIYKIKEIVNSGDLSKLHHVTLYRTDRLFRVEKDFN